MSGFAIICDARQGWKLGIDTLALVDRRATKAAWWTSDGDLPVMRFRKRSAAEYSAKRLARNNARVVPYDHAARILKDQSNAICDEYATAAMGEGWDAHK